MEQAFTVLLSQLETIGKKHQELYDTDVKEQTGQLFIEIFFLAHTDASIPNEYGMFTNKGNKAIEKAFNVFSRELARSGDFATAKEDRKWQIFNSVATGKGQIAENFFGALTPSNVHPTAKKRTGHWLQAAPVYYFFTLAPGIIIFLVVILAFPHLVNGPIQYLVLIIASGFLSLYVGDSSWQFLANKTYRKRHDQHNTGSASQ